jgi:hypothetical protein
MSILSKATRHAILDSDSNITRIVVDESGHVNVRTYEERGDGGPTPWWKFIGFVEEVEREYGPSRTEVTDTDIRALLTEAGEAGDWKQVILCRIALGRDPEPQDAEERQYAYGWDRRTARELCEEAISDARAQR